MEGRWQKHPDAKSDSQSLPPVQPGRVTGIGAICDLGQHHFEQEQHSQSFSVSEFVTLEDGRQVTLHKDRGFTIGWRSSTESTADEKHDHETRSSIIQNVMNVVLPDDEDCAESHPWSWLAQRAQSRGLNVTAEGLRSLTYEIVLTDSVVQWLVPA